MSADPTAPAPHAASAPLLADAHLPRAAGPRQSVDVAVGVLRRADGSFLMTSRPEGKAYAGYWEFPGGKFEPGEDNVLALRRELAEELAITATDIRPWRSARVDYPHALVHLHFCQVWAWQGNPQPQEAQQLAWQRFPLDVTPVLPGSVPVLRWLAQDLGCESLCIL